jgi:hypothetical protein
MMARKAPEVVELDTQELEALRRRAQDQALEEDDYETIAHVFDSYVYVTSLIRDKNIAISRLRKMIFGSKTEKTRGVIGPGDESPDDDCESSSSDDGTSTTSDEDPANGDDPSLPNSGQSGKGPSRKGHGRNGADAYRGAKQVEVPHCSLEPGCACPECEHGKLYEVRTPGVLVRVVGQAPLQATVYHLQKLRCHLCGKVFTASPPADAGARKYDATAGSMIALLKYGTGMPFNRVSGLQRNVQIPLPPSTQWDVIAAYAPSAAPAYEALIWQAAQGEVVHNDDTTVKILECLGERAKKQPLDEDERPGRTGLFTSGVVSTCEGRRVALFFSGRRHAGENLSEVLQHRAEELENPIQMCDALSRNMSAELQTIVANCMAHGRRQFVDVGDHFPDECRYVLEAIKVVYRTDAEARKRELSPAKRLQLHRAKSGQPMTRLHNWLKRQLDQKLVEPNSSLGDAINYMLRHWEKLTRFLQVPGAPLDNNICERALKKAILHRKNALFYKTRRGARIGDMYMSLIYTCELCQISPFEYLTALHGNADQVADDPHSWLPWNYQEAVGAASVLVDA